MDFEEQVPVSALDVKEILRRGGKNRGEEDFELVKCPNCVRVYLLECEVFTIFTNANDLTERINECISPRRFDCLDCGVRFPETSAWIGAFGPASMIVTWDHLAKSPWRWVAPELEKASG